MGAIVIVIGLIFFLGIGLVGKLTSKVIIGTAVGISKTMKVAADKVTESPNNESHVNQNIKNIILIIAKLSNPTYVNEFNGKLKVIVEWLRINFDFDDAKLNIYGKIFDNALNNESYDYHVNARSLYLSFSKDKQILIAIINLLFKVAMVNGNLTGREEKIIEDTCSIFNISEYEYESIKRFYSTKGNFNPEHADKPTQTDNYDILGCDKTANIEEIHKAYEELSKKYNPGIIASKGLAEEYIEFARLKFNSIKNAYDSILKEHIK